MIYSLVESICTPPLKPLFELLCFYLSLIDILGPKRIKMINRRFIRLFSQLKSMAIDLIDNLFDWIAKPSIGGILTQWLLGFISFLVLLLIVYTPFFLLHGWVLDWIIEYTEYEVVVIIVSCLGPALLIFIGFGLALLTFYLVFHGILWIIRLVKKSSLYFLYTLKLRGIFLLIAISIFTIMKLGEYFITP